MIAIPRDVKERVFSKKKSNQNRFSPVAFGSSFSSGFVTILTPCFDPKQHNLFNQLFFFFFFSLFFFFFFFCFCFVFVFVFFFVFFVFLFFFFFSRCAHFLFCFVFLFSFCFPFSLLLIFFSFLFFGSPVLILPFFFLCYPRHRPIKRAVNSSKDEELKIFRSNDRLPQCCYCTTRQKHSAHNYANLCN